MELPSSRRFLQDNFRLDRCFDGFIVNYMGIDRLGSYLISLIVAIVLSMFIAFHPKTFGKERKYQRYRSSQDSDFLCHHWLSSRGYRS